jgi:hypothetical protein
MVIVIDVAIPVERPVRKEGEKKLKYKLMCSDRVNVEHEVYYYTGNNRTTGIITEGLRKHLEAIPRKHSIDSLRKTAILGMEHHT